MSKVAIVTGAARGLGEAIAKRLARDGNAVAIADLNLEGAERVAAEIREAGGRAAGFAVDVADQSSAGALVRRVAEMFGDATILVNNAGISPKHDGRKAPVMEMKLDEWRAVMDINLTSVFIMSQACVPAMRRIGWGRIVSMSSEAGRCLVPVVSGAHYAASKAGVIGFSWVLASEVAEFGITVNCVAPGRSNTFMASNAARDVAHVYESAIPMKRNGTPEEMAAAVSFLASDDASYITGATIDVNGGHAML